MPKHAVRVQISPTDESLPAEIHRIGFGCSFGCIEALALAVVFRDKIDNVNAKYTIAYKKLMKTRNLFVMIFYSKLIMYEPELQFIV